MDRFEGKQQFPSKRDASGDLDGLAVTEMAMHLVPGAIMLSLRCADTEAAITEGGNQTIQLGLSLPQVRDLMEILKTGEMVLESAQKPGGVSH